MERKLAAIFALDMVSFSRLMEADEKGTLKRHRAHVTELLEPTVEAHHGHVVKGTGDGLLCEFASAVDAVECAAEIQREMPAREEGIPADRRIVYRIGINVGDIVVDDGDIYGDGVNVAARIESLADAGGVFISDSAYGQVRNKVELGFEDLGLREVKNIEEPVRVYSVLLDPAAAADTGRKRKGWVKEAFRRRVPQVVGGYLVASFALLEFTDWAVNQYGLSPTLSSFVVSLLLLMLPAVAWVTWHHGAPGPDAWTKADGLAIAGNLVLAAIVLFPVAGFEIGELTTSDPEAYAARQTRESALDALEETEDPRRIAVLYFEPRSPEEEMPYLAAGLTEALISELGAIPALDVRSRNASALYRDEVVSPDSIGRALRVGTLVDGTVAQSGDRIRVNVEFVNSSTGENFGRTLVERPRTELFELQDDLANEVALFLRGSLGAEIEVIERQRGAEENLEAWELMQRARSLSDQAGELHDAGSEEAWLRIAASDSLLELAEQVAPEWVEPTINRGWLDYQRSRWTGLSNQSEGARWTAEGLEHARIALSLDSLSADALELKGKLAYWRWLLNVERDPDAARELFEQAEVDLRQAISLNADQAGAWDMLSHLLLNKEQVAEGKTAAARAYQADAYLRNADVILWRLFTTSYDLQDQPEADHWCGELTRRFPANQRAIECGLWQMTMSGAEVDVDSVWALSEAYSSTLSPESAEFFSRWAGMGVAAALARAGLADSAGAVAERSRGDAEIDPAKDLVYLEAFVRTLTGETEMALDLLAEYMALGGDDGSALDHWWFDPLREEPRYKTLAGT